MLLDRCRLFGSGSEKCKGDSLRKKNNVWGKCKSFKCGSARLYTSTSAGGEAAWMSLWGPALPSLRRRPAGACTASPLGTLTASGSCCFSYCCRAVDHLLLNNVLVETEKPRILTDIAKWQSFVRGLKRALSGGFWSWTCSFSEGFPPFSPRLCWEG